MKTETELALCRALDALCAAVEAQYARNSPDVSAAVAEGRRTLGVVAHWAPNGLWRQMKLTDAEAALFCYANERWPNRDLPGRLRKLGEEFGELSEAVARLLSRNIGGEEALQAARETALLEAADCSLVLDDIAALIGTSMTAAKAVKLKRNRDRNAPDTKAKGTQ